MIEIVLQDFLAIMFLFLRVAGMVFTAPFISDKQIPVKARLILSLLLAYIVFYAQPEFDYSIQDSVIYIFIYGLKEILVGLTIGLMIKFIFWGISFAGSLIGFQMGLAMAQAFDPSSDTENNVIGTVLSMVAILIFILVNGHHYLIRSVVYSYKIIPIGGMQFTENLYQLLIKYSFEVFILAAKIAAPLIVSFFLINVAGGIISRMIPQMQVFFVLQPLQIGLGFLLITMLIPVYVFFVKNLIELYENKLYDVLRAMVV